MKEVMARVNKEGMSRYRVTHRYAYRLGGKLPAIRQRHSTSSPVSVVRPELSRKHTQFHLSSSRYDTIKFL